MEVIVKYNGDIFSVADRINAFAERLSENYAIITLPESSLEELYSFTEIEDIEIPKRLYINSIRQLSSSCIPSVQSNTGYGLSGNGVIVSVIDSGIDFTHPDFRNDDGTTRIISIWDQTIDGSPPQGFNEGTEYSAQLINYALQQDDPFSVVPSRDYIGHGTAVAGIAAGNGNASFGENIGAAPQSELIIVKVGRRGSDIFAQSTDIMRALRYTIDKARETGKPTAINLSFGMNNGSHDGTSLFEEYIASAANEWKVVIVTPTGNEGAAGHHYEGRLTQGNTANISFFTASGIEGFYISLWKDFADVFSVELIYPDGSSSGIVRAEDSSKTLSLRDTFTEIIYGQPTRYSADQEVFINVRSKSGYLNAGSWTLKIRPSSIANGKIQLWLPTTEEVGTRTYFSEPTINNTMTIPSTAEKVIRVSGYNDSIGSIAAFSGIGSSDGCRSPDISAPAVNIIAPGVGGGYDTFTGTSFAAPFVTGAAALIMEWAIVQGNSPFLYGERIRAFLRSGAERRTGTEYPQPTFGYGKLCLEKTLNQIVLYTG